MSSLLSGEKWWLMEEINQAEERSKLCEVNIAKYRSSRAASEMTPAPVSWMFGKFTPFAKIPLFQM